MDDMKKEFQKMVKAFRDELPDRTITNWRTGREMTVRPEFPKAMMTGQQMSKKTATINFGREDEKDNWTAAAAFFDYPPFIAWLQKYGILGAGIETSSDHNVQIRVKW